MGTRRFAGREKGHAPFLLKKNTGPQGTILASVGPSRTEWEKSTLNVSWSGPIRGNEDRKIKSRLKEKRFVLQKKNGPNGHKKPSTLELRKRKKRGDRRRNKGRNSTGKKVLTITEYLNKGGRLLGVKDAIG